MEIKNFKFITSNGTIRICPFRVGDIVTVENWGESYSTYPLAYIHFTGESNTPYYSKFGRPREKEKKFKIIDLAEHSSMPDRIIAYIKDREGHDQVIGIKGLKLIKQYPLRIGEKTEIHLEKIR